MSSETKKPLLPLRDIVIFPSIVVPLFVGRKKSIKALEEVMKSDKSVVLVTQKNSEVDDPTEKDIYSYGCLSKVLQLLKLQDGTVKVELRGSCSGCPSSIVTLKNGVQNLLRHYIKEVKNVEAI